MAQGMKSQKELKHFKNSETEFYRGIDANPELSKIVKEQMKEIALRQFQNIHKMINTAILITLTERK